MGFANEDEDEEDENGTFMASLSYKNVPLISKTSSVDENPPKSSWISRVSIRVIRY